MSEPLKIKLQLFDIVVIGGGPSGASVAGILAGKGYSVAIIERTDYSDFRTGETLPPKINGAIARFSTENDVFYGQMASYANLSCWGGRSLMENNFLSNPFGNGWHLDRNKFDAALIKHARLMGCEVFLHGKIAAIQKKQSGRWTIHVSCPDAEYNIESRFAVDASGRSAVLAKYMGGKRISHDHLIAITAILQKIPVVKYSNCTLVEAVENGWWYSADLPDNKIVFSYMTDADLYKQAAKKCGNVLDTKISETKFIKERASHRFSYFSIAPANTFIIDRQYGDNWLSVGDAAMAYDPLSSSGILRAINDGIRAADDIARHFAGNKTALKRSSDRYKQKYVEFLHAKTCYYRLEERWSHAPFWKRRTGLTR